MAGALAEKEFQEVELSHAKQNTWIKKSSMSLLQQTIAEHQDYPEFIAELQRMDPNLALAEEHFLKINSRLQETDYEFAAVSQSGGCVVGDVFEEVEELSSREFSTERFVIRRITS